MAHREIHLTMSDTRVQFFDEHESFVVCSSTDVNPITVVTGGAYNVSWKQVHRKPYGFKNGKYTVDKLYMEGGSEMFVKFKGYNLVVPVVDIVFTPFTN